MKTKQNKIKRKTKSNIYNSDIYLYQIQSIVIYKDLWNFFNEHLNNSVEF